MKKPSISDIREAAANPVATWIANRETTEVRRRQLEFYASERDVATKNEPWETTLPRNNPDGARHWHLRAQRYRKAAEIIERSLQERS